MKAYLSDEQKKVLANARAYLKECEPRLNVPDVMGEVDGYLARFQLAYSIHIRSSEKSPSDVVFSDEFMALVHKYSSPERVDKAEAELAQEIYDRFLKPSVLDDFFLDDESLN